MDDGRPDSGAFTPIRNTVRAIATLPPFVAGHAWRSRLIRRSHSHAATLGEQPPPHRHHPELQSRDDGVGPIVMRTYEVDIVDPVLEGRTLMADFRTDPDHFVPNLLAGFVRGDRPVRNLDVDDDLVVELPGPWNGPCTVDQVDDTSVTLATLNGHMEAGHVRFATLDSDGGYTFQIRSWARAGDVGFALLHLGLPIGRELQTAMWCALCERAVAVSGGRRNGAFRVSTEILNESDPPMSTAR